MRNKRILIPLFAIFIQIIIFILFYGTVMQDAIVDEIILDAKGLDGTYNIISLLYYLFLALFILIIINEILKSWNVNVNHNFVIAMIPFILLGSVLRVVEDIGIIPYPYSIFAVSPIIYLTITFIILIFLYFKRNFEFKFIKGREFFILYSLVIIFQAIDAIITIVGFEYFNYVEKNLMSSLFIESLPISFLFYKILLGIGFVYFFNYKTRVVSEEPTRFEYIILLGMIAIGLAPAVRNLFRIMLGV